MDYTENFPFLFPGRQDCSDGASWGPGKRSSYVIHYIIRGSGYFTCNGKTYTLHAGQSFLIRPMVEIRYGPIMEDPWEYVWVEFVDSQYLPLLELLPFTEGNCILDVVPPENLLPYFEHMFNPCPVPQRTTMYVKQGMLRTILGVYAGRGKGPQKQSREADYYMAACTMIGQFYHSAQFTLDTICRELNITYNTLCRSFRSAGVVPPAKYLQQYRIDQAKRQLGSAGTSIKSVALSCGFSDPLHFSRVFRANTGLSPREFIRQNR